MPCLLMDDLGLLSMEYLPCSGFFGSSGRYQDHEPQASEIIEDDVDAWLSKDMELVV